MRHAAICLVAGIVIAGCSSSSGSSSGSGTQGDGGLSSASYRVRRSWATLSAAERKKVVDAFVALKKKTALTWSYRSYCESPAYGPLPPYTKNAYDYFVELHV